MDIQSTLGNIIFLNLLVLTIVSWAYINYPSIKFLSVINSWGAILTNLLLFYLLLTRWINFGYFPLSNLYESLLFLAWGITFTTIVIERRSQITFINAITIPITLFAVGFASLSLPENMQVPTPLVPALKSNWLMMHVTVMMLSYASLIIGSLLGVFFLILSKITKVKPAITNSLPINIESSPSLETAFYKAESADFSILKDTNQHKAERMNLLESVDNLSYRTIGFGFPLLTLGIIAGAVWANEAWGSYWSWDPKETWALITWLVFASYLHARLTKAWQGEKPALIAALGFIVVWVCYLGVNFLGKGLHTYGQLF